MNKEDAGFEAGEWEEGDEGLEHAPLLVYEPGGGPVEPRPLILPPDVQAVEFAKVKNWPVRWLWEPYLPMGYLSLLLGEPGAGKTWAALSLAAMLSKGSALPSPQTSAVGAGFIPPHPPEGGENPAPTNRTRPPAFPARILYVTGEDRGPGIRARLERLGADLSNVYFFQDDSDHPFRLTNLTPLSYALQQIRPAPVVLDPFQAFWGKGGGLGQAEQVRELLTPLARQAWSYECAVLLVGHLTKKDPGRSIHRNLGSVDLTAVARSVMLVGREGTGRAERRALVHVKSCYASEGAPLKFSIDGEGVHWLGASSITATDLLEREQPGYTRTALEEAAEFLRIVLRDGPREAAEIFTLAAKERFSTRTIYRAREDLRLIQVKKGPGATWALPENAPPQGGGRQNGEMQELQ